MTHMVYLLLYKQIIVYTNNLIIGFPHNRILLNISVLLGCPQEIIQQIHRCNTFVKSLDLNKDTININ